MDVFEKSGWTVLSMWNCSAGEGSQPAQPAHMASSVSDKPGSGPISDSTSGATNTADVAAGAEPADFKGECVNFLLFKNAGAGRTCSVPCARNIHSQKNVTISLSSAVYECCHSTLDGGQRLS